MTATEIMTFRTNFPDLAVEERGDRILFHNGKVGVLPRQFRRLGLLHPRIEIQSPATMTKRGEKHRIKRGLELLHRLSAKTGIGMHFDMKLCGCPKHAGTWRAA